MAANNKPFLHEIIGGNVYIAQYVKGFAATKKFRCFQPETMLKYHPFCDDFGPMNIGAIIRFIQLLDHEIASAGQSKIVHCVDEGKRAMTNAVFLHGAYLILKNDMTAQSVCDKFDWLDPTMIEPFRDATYSRVTFGLTLLDCWAGLERGKALGWVHTESRPGIWGNIDILEYEHYDEPRNGDLHAVVPGRFIAFRGPIDLDDDDDDNAQQQQSQQQPPQPPQPQQHQKQPQVFRDTDGVRQFSPRYYIQPFLDMGVSAVIRLNEPDSYNPDIFPAHGIAHYDLEFPDCTAPPPALVDRFFAIVDAAAAAAAASGGGGAVAVHCRAGIGRTGTLIALYLMRSNGFSPREAMGWLRIMRPGCVIGQQQHFLCAPAAAAAAGPAAESASDSDGLGNLKDSGAAGRRRRAEIAAGAARSDSGGGGVSCGGGGGGGGGGGRSLESESAEDCRCGSSCGWQAPPGPAELAAQVAAAVVKRRGGPASPAAAGPTGEWPAATAAAAAATAAVAAAAAAAADRASLKGCDLGLPVEWLNTAEGAR